MHNGGTSLSGRISVRGLNDGYMVRPGLLYSNPSERHCDQRHRLRAQAKVQDGMPVGAENLGIAVCDGTHLLADQLAPAPAAEGGEIYTEADISAVAVDKPEICLADERIDRSAHIHGRIPGILL